MGGKGLFPTTTAAATNVSEGAKLVEKLQHSISRLEIRKLLCYHKFCTTARNEAETAAKGLRGEDGKVGGG